MRVSVLFCIAIMLAATPAPAQVLQREPPMGALTDGQTVLVDDGRCPRGQVMQVVGGNHVKAGGFKQIVRTRSCVPRPN